MISAFVETNNQEATQKLYAILDQIDLPSDVHLTINNLDDAESGILRKDGKVIDISLAHCFTLEDTVRELVTLLSRT